MYELNKKLYLAAIYGNIIQVKLCLKLGADIHHNNNAALRWAVYHNQYESAKILLEHGAKVFEEDNEAFKDALVFRNLKMCKLLLKYGAEMPKFMSPHFTNFLIKTKQQLNL